jgi:hypothetical protein
LMVSTQFLKHSPTDLLKSRGRSKNKH